jgi:hypothetical protein
VSCLVVAVDREPQLHVVDELRVEFDPAREAREVLLGIHEIELLRVAEEVALGAWKERPEAQVQARGL